MAKEPKTLSQSPEWKDPLSSKVVKNMKYKVLEMFDSILLGKKVEMEEAACDGWHVPFPSGNTKLGSAVCSFSLPPVIACGNCKSCMKTCYDLKHDVTHTACLEMRCLTYAILKADPIRFWAEVKEKAKTCECIRVNVGGDIVDADYFFNLRSIAKDVPSCKFLIFTKMYDIVNKSIDELGDLPENLHLIMSRWPGTELKNPHKLPVSFPVFSDKDCEKRDDLKRFQEESPKFYWHCNDDCTECSQCGSGCFALKKGESVGFNYH